MGGKDRRFAFEGKNIYTDRLVRGEVVAADEEEARKKLQRRGIRPLRIDKVKTVRTRKITQEDITVFTRQLATMMKAGLPLLQAFDIIARGHSNPAVTQMLTGIRTDVEQGSSLAVSFGKYPKYFDRFYCNLVAAGETGGVLETLLDKLATYREKTLAVKRKIKTMMIYPMAILVVSSGLVFVMMRFVLPAFKEIYTNMGAQLPLLTQYAINLSDFVVEYGWLLLVATIVAGVSLYRLHEKSYSLQKRTDALLLRTPLFGSIVRKAAIARWSRTLSTLFAAGVPLVEVLDSVAAASGNLLYEEATLDIRAQVTQGLSLASSMQPTNMFPNMVVQMAAVGEESGALDDMLNKAAEFYEDEVDNLISRLSALIEPIIMIVIGVTVGILLIAMYLPLLNLGKAVG
ncbi:type II secretion system F family protein [Neisseria animalis]|uniref:Type II secretion system F family protein n=2 Tax=Neisseria animalis TaxID=492 RepID=A0A5P3MW70_NEIAN|nr:type II secretion system F family protein [Neisseria animalis]ROW32257.1 type II secretion system F family protein [Neisseria animalis]